MGLARARAAARSGSPTAPAVSTPVDRRGPVRVLMVVAILAVVGPERRRGPSGRHRHASERAVAWFAPYIDTTLTPLHAFEDPEVTPADTSRSASSSPGPGADSASCTPDLGRRVRPRRGGHRDRPRPAHRPLPRSRREGGRVLRWRRQPGARGRLPGRRRPGPCLPRRDRPVRQHHHRPRHRGRRAGRPRPRSCAGREPIAEVQREPRLAWRPPRRCGSPCRSPPRACSPTPSRSSTPRSTAGVDLGGRQPHDDGLRRRPAAVPPDGRGRAAVALGPHRQLADAYRRAGSTLDSTEVWGKLGATPMIGVNDTLTDVFTRADGKALVDFARDRGLGRLSMWSANRDAPCPGGPDPSEVSNTCSGLAQAPLDFSRILDRVSGRALADRARHDHRSPIPASVDDPDTSPYPVWADGRRVRERATGWSASAACTSPSGGPRVTTRWRRWPTCTTRRGGWSAPCSPSDRPPSTTTLPAGTYPDWDATVAYRPGDRVLRARRRLRGRLVRPGHRPGRHRRPADGPSPWRPLARAERIG